MSTVKKGFAEEKVSLESSIMCSIEMTRAALRLIKGHNPLWHHADIVAEPTQRGMWIGPVTRGISNDDDLCFELTRLIIIRGVYQDQKRGNDIAEFESKCKLARFFRYWWTPQSVDMTIGSIDYHFRYTNGWRSGKYHSKIKLKNKSLSDHVVELGSGY